MLSRITATDCRIHDCCQANFVAAQGATLTLTGCEVRTRALLDVLSVLNERHGHAAGGAYVCSLC